MEEKKNIFSFIGEAFCTYSIAVIILTITAAVTGDEAGEISTLFRLGSQGIPLSALVQFLAVAFLTTGLRYLFSMDWMVKRVPPLLRVLFMCVLIVACIVLFTNLFGWFPADMWEPWAAFAACILLCFAGGTVTMIVKTRLENRQMAEGLRRLKESMGKEEKDEA